MEAPPLNRERYALALAFAFGKSARSHERLACAPDGKTSREERLAANLRENLRRRKEQARALERPDDALPKKPEDG